MQVVSALNNGIWVMLGEYFSMLDEDYLMLGELFIMLGEDS
jgi:hypothetical protein